MTRIVMPILLLLSLVSCSSYAISTIRYRLTFEIEANGEVKSASSVIQLKYYQGQSTTGSPVVLSATYGVSPVIDLGKSGMLLLSIGQHHWGTKFLQRKIYDAPCGGGFNDGDLVTAVLVENTFGLNVRNAGNNDKQWQLARKIGELRQGKRTLNQNNLPAFIWFPENGSYDQGQYLCADEFSHVLGDKVTLRSVTVEIAPTAQVVEKLEVHTPWLEQLRAKQKSTNHTFDRYDVFVPRLSQFEKHGR